MNRFFYLVFIFLATCSNNDLPEIVDCTSTDLTIELISKSDPINCETTNGTIEVVASGGKPPYQFRLSSGSFKTSSLFSNLGAGSFTITVMDSDGCERQLTNIVIVAPEGPIANASTVNHQTNCFEPNGSITIHVTNGQPPYQYKMKNGSFASTATFSDLQAGLYSIIVRDDGGCETEINETIAGNTGVSYQSDIKPILQANCIRSGCHNGDNGSERNWNIFVNVKAKAQQIKGRTADRSMPPVFNSPGMPQNEIDLIACWVDGGAQNN